METKGSGYTTREIMTQLKEMVLKKYLTQLQALGPKAFKKSDLASLESGFKDGMSSAIQHLQGMGVFVILDETKKDPS